MGSKSKSTIMKSNSEQIIARKLKNQKTENALDIISKSVEGKSVIEKNYDLKFGFTIGYTKGSKSK